MPAAPPDILADRFRRLIETSGPISVARYMAEANAHYYATRDPLGRDGDFITAPEISQMFGELIGLWLADLWQRAGAPDAVRYVELGPGRGTLAVDALRAMRSAGLRPLVDLVETSPALREAQRARVPAAEWHNDLASAAEAPLLLVANEFFDALPVRQSVATEHGWHERLVTISGEGFAPVAGSRVPIPIAPAAPGTIVETSPASVAIVREIARRLVAHGGAALIIDYGHERTGTGDTLQAVEKHGYADPWMEPGTRDLTAHVDFEALRQAAGAEGALCRFATQGEWLIRMGVGARAAALARSAPHRSAEIEVAMARLTAPDQMGRLFKVLALTSPTWPEPAGFA